MTWVQIIDDTFARADSPAGLAGTTTGAGGDGKWTDVHGGVCSIAANRLRLLADSIDGAGYSRDWILRDASENHQDIKLDITISPDDGDAHAGLIGRWAAGQPYYIAIFNYTAANGQMTGSIYAISAAGTVSDLATDWNFTAPRTTGTLLQLELAIAGISHTSLTVNMNDVTSGSTNIYTQTVTDTADHGPQTSGQMGVIASGPQTFTGNLRRFQSYFLSTATMSVSPSSTVKNTTTNLTLTGTGTGWTSSSAFTVSGGTINSKTFTDATHVTLNYTAPSSTGTVTITDSTNGETCALAINNAAATDFSLSPNPLNASAGTASGNVTVTMNGTLSASETVVLSDGGAGGAFTPGSLSFSTSDTSKTFTYTPASGAGGTSPKLTATGTGAFSASRSIACNVGTGPAVVPATDANMHFSPYAWDPNIVSGHRRCLGPGGYLKTAFSGTSAILKLSAPSGTPQVRWSIDGGAYSVAEITSGTLSLATGLSSGTHTLDFEYMAANGGVGWSNSPAPNQYVEIISITLDAGASSQARADIGSKNMIFFGTSITQGVAATGTSNGTNGIGYDDALNTYCLGVAQALGAEYGQLGYTGQGYTFASAGGAGPPKFYTIGDPANSSWWQYQGGSSRLVGGLFSPVPEIILIEQCRNDYAAADAVLEALIKAALSDIRAAAPGSWLFHMVPFDGTKRSAIQTAIAAYKAAAADTKCAAIDVSMDSYFNGSLKTGAGVASVGAIDGTHPDFRTHGVAAGKVAAAIQAAMSTGTGTAPPGYSRTRIANA